jgi:hypothetical protein
MVMAALSRLLEARAALRQRPCREFAPAGDLLFERPKSRQKVAPRAARPFASLWLPCAAQALRARAKLASLRCAQTVARSQFLKRAARAPSSPSAARRAQGGTAGTATTEGMWRLAVGCFGCSGLPLQNRREAQKPGARAQRASTSDFAPLCLNVANAVSEVSWARPRASSIAGNPPAGWAVLQGPLFAYFLAGQKTEGFGAAKVGRPPGRIPGTDRATKPTPQQARLAGNNEAHA